MILEQEYEWVEWEWVEWEWTLKLHRRSGGRRPGGSGRNKEGERNPTTMDIGHADK
jgi:hypothetical protein